MKPPLSPALSPALPRPWIWPAVVMTIGVLLSVFVWQLTSHFVARKEAERFAFETNEATNIILEHIDSYQIALLGGVGLFAASDDVNRDGWRAFAQSLRTERYFPGIQGIGFAQHLFPTELDAHVADVRAEGFPAYSLRPAGERDDYTAIVFLEPFDERNRQAFGYDMFSEPTRHAAMARARDTNETILSGRVTLVQEIDEDVQAGFLMYVPVYRRHQPIGTVAERQAALHGYVYSPFRAGQLVRGIFPKGLERLRLQIHDGPQVTPEFLLFADPAPNQPSAHRHRRLFEARSVELYGRTWTLSFETRPAFFNTAELYLPTATLTVALLLSALFALLTWAQSNLRLKAKNLEGEIAARRDAENEAHRLNQELEQRVRERTSELNITALALRENEERMRLATTAAGIGVWVWEIDEQIQRWDDRMFAIHGLPPTSDLVVTHRDWQARVFPDDLEEQNARLVRTVSRKGRDQREFRIIRANDETVRFVQSAEMVIAKGDGTPSRVIGINVDITERKETEAKLHALNLDLEQRVEDRTRDFELARVATLSLLQDTEQQKQRVEEVLATQREIGEKLQAANAELAQASRHKDEFLANMSHELRTPLNAILGLSEAMLEQHGGPLSDRHVKSVTTISTSGQHLLELINDILDLSQIGAGSLKLCAESLEVEPFCESCLLLVRTQAMRKNLRILLSPTFETTHIFADPKRFKQVMVNLLTNAVKFTPPGGNIGLDVVALPTECAVRFTVWDTGIGIAAEDQSKLFRAFTQLDAGLNRAQEGTGLGLAMVAKLVELHGGRVSVESEVGQGSRFSVTLPQPQEVMPEVSPLPVPNRRDYRRVMLIEDDVNAREQIERYLGELNISTISKTLGHHVVETAAREQPDAILLDILLPDESGLTVLQRLKETPATRDIPVVLISVMDEPADSPAPDAAAYFTKPVTRTALAQFFQREAIKSSASTPPFPQPEPDRDQLILLAEDNETNIETIGGYLEETGYAMIFARNGLEAVRLTNAHHPSLILMDIQMPEMDGLAAIRKIRANESIPNVPIIALTALAMPGDRERCLEAGATEYISKPVKLRELVSLMKQLLTS
ncbi:CHASE domain-containing protein [Synoicihabitans lomoniglobus]|uniref:histidine kinase n=1 Tax=Synoicihabitans lomoniglobus TaxID=2909285 RepID=A0AAF0CPV1_9BACT|nr:CHASE domain-containing protein [Opitutaceae bacterium LMO-M01]WED65861.1 CHASE domain-containing protein [Opitutaceae bacterium LMO-M01]